MQQTTKYKLNLIESSDPFLPEGLNQNTQKIEDAMAAHEAAVAADVNAKTTALEQRLVKIACGTAQMGERYSYQTIKLDFTPKAALVYFYPGDDNRCMLVVGNEEFSDITGSVQLIPNGLRLKVDGICNYIVFG